jgi:hypothetical protein
MMSLAWQRFPLVHFKTALPHTRAFRSPPPSPLCFLCLMSAVLVGVTCLGMNPYGLGWGWLGLMCHLCGGRGGVRWGAAAPRCGAHRRGRLLRSGWKRTRAERCSCSHSRAHGRVGKLSRLLHCGKPSCLPCFSQGWSIACERIAFRVTERPTTNLARLTHVCRVVSIVGDARSRRCPL